MHLTSHKVLDCRVSDVHRYPSRPRPRGAGAAPGWGSWQTRAPPLSPHPSMVAELWEDATCKRQERSWRLGKDPSPGLEARGLHARPQATLAGHSGTRRVGRTQGAGEPRQKRSR